MALNNFGEEPGIPWIATHTIGRCSACTSIHPRDAGFCANCGHNSKHDDHGCPRGRTWKSQPFDTLAPAICYCREFVAIETA